MRRHPNDGAPDNGGACSGQTIVIVDPVHSGFDLALRAQELGYHVIPIFTTPIYMVSQEILLELDAGFIHFETDLQRALRVIAVSNEKFQGAAQIVAVIPGSEPGVELAGSLASAMGLPHNTSTGPGAFRDKRVMRRIWEQSGRAQPRFCECRSPDEVFQFATEVSASVVVKTPCGAGTDHVIRCDTPLQAREAACRILGSRDLFAQEISHVLAEEMIAGPEYIVDLFGMGDGRFELVGIWAYDKTDDFRVISARAVDPKQPACEALIDEAIEGARALGVFLGLAHCEIRLDPRRGPVIIEVGARLPGARLVDLYLERVGENILDLTLKAFICGRMENMPGLGEAKPAIVVFPQIEAQGPCVVTAISGAEEIGALASAVRVDLNVQVGSVISEARVLGELPALFALSHDDLDTLQEDIAKTHAFSLSLEPAPRSIALLLEEGFPASAIHVGGKIGESYHRNVSDFMRDIPAVIFPANREDVCAALRAARRSPGQIKLFPVSTGKNWSLGSKLPVCNDTIVMDLRRMDELIEVNETEGYAIVSPGTMWGALAEYLEVHYPDWLINPLGGYGGSSLMGNSLDRGDGLFGGRADDILGLEVMLADGETYPVGGFWRDFAHGIDDDADPATPSHYYSAGIGPSLAPSFVQSNFGVTLSMVHRLHRRPEHRELVWAIFPRRAVLDVAKRLQRLCDAGIAERGQVQIGYEVPGDYSSSVKEGMQGIAEIGVMSITMLLSGDRDLVALKRGKALEALGEAGLGCLSSGAAGVTPDDIDALGEEPPFVRLFAKAALGRPNWTRIAALYPEGTRKHRYFLDADETGAGLLSFLPALPGGDPVHFERALSLLERCTPAGTQPIIGMKLSGLCLIMIPFDRSDRQAAENAKLCRAQLFEAFMDRGYFPHRADIEGQADVIARLPRQFDLVARLKKALDPDGILAPGRYCPAPGAASGEEEARAHR